MKTLKQIKTYKSKCETLDSRDISRLLHFFPPSEWKEMGFEIREGVDIPEIKTLEYSRENVLEKLKADLDFAFDKALGQRGISSSLMFEVIKMWMWVLDDELQNFPDDNYAQYGLPLFKAVAVKYNLENRIGEDNGDESAYSCDYGY